jgi:hypothetical protein
MRSLLVLLFVLAACKGTHKDKAPTPPPVTGPSVIVKVDGRTLTTVAITKRTPLATLVPTTPPWLFVEASAPDGRYLELDTPATTYPGAELRLDLQNGHISLGVYNPPLTDAPPGVIALAAQPIAILPDVTEIDVLTHPRPAPAATGIEVVNGGQPARVVTSGDLESLVEPRPRPRIRGWALRDVIELAAPGAGYGGVQVIAEGAQQIFSHDEISAPKGSILLKMNQRGQYVLQVWDDGVIDRPRLQLRDVKRLVLQPPR